MDIISMAYAKKLVNGLQSGLDTASVDNDTCSITFHWKNGTSSTMTFPKPLDGANGVGISDVKLKEVTAGSGKETHLICTLEDGTEIDAGNIPNYDDTEIKKDINEVDGKIEALKTSQNLKYEGTDVICNNTLASRTSDMFIKGKSYLNLGTGGLESAGEKENKISILSHTKNLLNPNKLFLNNSSIIKENGAFICPSNVSWQAEKIMGVDLSKPLYFAYEIKSDENIIIDTTNQSMLIRLDYVKTGSNVRETNIPIGKKITNEYTKFIFKNISLSNTEQGIKLVFRNGVGKKMYIRNITISNAPIDDVIPYQQDKKEILLPIDGGLKSLPNGKADTIEQRSDGVYLVQRVGKYVFTGNEDLKNSHSSPNNYLQFYDIPNIKTFNSSLMCDTLIVRKDVAGDKISATTTNYGIMSCGNANEIRIRIKGLESDVNGTKNWFKQNRTTVYYELNAPVETKLDIQNIVLEVYKDITYVTTENTIQPTLSFKVPSNIGGVTQENAQNINELYKLIDEVIIPQLINNSADIEILKLK